MAVSRSKTKSRSFTKASPIISRSHSPKEMTRKVSIPTPHSSMYRIQHRKRQIDLSLFGLAAEKVGVGSGSVKVRILPSRYFSHCRRWRRVAGKTGGSVRNTGSCQQTSGTVTMGCGPRRGTHSGASSDRVVGRRILRRNHWHALSGIEDNIKYVPILENTWRYFRARNMYIFNRKLYSALST